MRVLVVTNQWPSPEAPQRVLVARQVDGLRDAGVDTDVLTIAGIRSRTNYLRAMLRVALMTGESRRYDVIHAHTGHCGVIACVQFKYPVVLSYVGYDLDPDSADKIGGTADRARTALERAVFRRLSCLVAATITKSDRNREKLPRCGRSRNAVIPGGIDRSQFAPMPRTEARRRLGWAADAPTVLFGADPARFSKRFELAQAAVKHAQREVPALELAVAHDVPPERMPLWMNAADALLLTSRSEGSPNVVKEAMACNLPVVSVDVGDVAEIVAGIRLCYVCPPDASVIGSRIVDIVHSLPERSDGRDRTLDLALEAVTERVIDLYAQAATRRPGPLGFLSRG